MEKNEKKKLQHLQKKIFGLFWIIEKKNGAWLGALFDK